MRRDWKGCKVAEEGGLRETLRVELSWTCSKFPASLIKAVSKSGFHYIVCDGRNSRALSNCSSGYCCARLVLCLLTQWFTRRSLPSTPVSKMAARLCEHVKVPVNRRFWWSVHAGEESVSPFCPSRADRWGGSATSAPCGPLHQHPGPS